EPPAAVLTHRRDIATTAPNAITNGPGGDPRHDGTPGGSEEISGGPGVADQAGAGLVLCSQCDEPIPESHVRYVDLADGSQRHGTCPGRGAPMTKTPPEVANYDPATNDYDLAMDPRCLYGWGANCHCPFGHACFREYGHKGQCWDGGERRADDLEC